MTKASRNASNEHALFSVTQIEIVYRNKIRAAERPLVQNSKAAYDLLMSVWDRNKIELVEHSMLLLLNQANRCLGVSLLSTGGVSACIVDPKIVFATALKARASHIILAHNHPSESLKPSNADEILTNKLISGGRMLDVTVLDHLIVSPKGYHSFADYGLI